MSTFSWSNQLIPTVSDSLFRRQKLNTKVLSEHLPMTPGDSNGSDSDGSASNDNLFQRL